MGSNDLLPNTQQALCSLISSSFTIVSEWRAVIQVRRSTVQAYFSCSNTAGIEQNQNKATCKKKKKKIPDTYIPDTYNGEILEALLLFLWDEKRGMKNLFCIAGVL